MSEMIERVAQAIYAASDSRAKAIGWSNEPARVQDCYKRDAHAAIVAMIDEALRS